MKRLALKSLYILALLLIQTLLISCAALYWLLATENGAQQALSWVEQFEPRLEFHNPTGSLWHGLAFDHLRWQDDTLQVDLDQPSASWSSDCFWTLSLCVDKLTTEHLVVAISDSETDIPSPQKQNESGLPSVFLPFPLKIARADIKTFDLETGTTLNFDDLYLSGSWQGYTIKLEESGFELFDETWSLQGNIRLQRYYRLFLLADVSLPEDLGRAKIRAHNTLADLKLEAETQGPWPLTADASLALLEDKLPFTLKARLNTRKDLDLEGQTLSLDHPELQAEGNLEAMKVQLSSNLNTSIYPGDLKLKAKLQGHPEKFRIQQAELSLPDGSVAATGTVRQDKGWEWFGDVSWKGIRPEVWVKQLYGTSDGEAHITGRYRDTLEHMDIKVKSAHLDLPEGQVSATGQVQLDDRLRWSSELSWENVNLSTWHPDLASRLKGHGSVSGQYTDQLLSRLDMDLKVLTGEWQSQTLNASGKVKLNEGDWQISALKLFQDRNQIEVNGRLGSRNDLTAMIQLPDATRLWPGLEAVAQGEFNLTGNLESPRIQGELTLDQLAYEQFNAEGLQLFMDYQHHKDWTKATGDIELQGKKLSYQDQSLDTLAFSFSGSGRKHQFSLATSGHPWLAEENLACQGRLQRTMDWQGACDEFAGRLNVSHINKTFPWQNRQAIKLKWLQNDQQMRIAPFCLDSNDTSLCSQTPLRVGMDAVTGIDWQARALDWQWLQPLLPENWQLTGQTQLDLTADSYRFKAGPVTDQTKARFHLTSSALQLDRQPTETTQAALLIPVENLEFEGLVERGRASGQLHLDTQQFGNMAADLQLGKDKKLKGKLNIQDIDLQAFQPFAPDDSTITGVANADVNISGELANPLLSGDIRISNAAVENEYLPTPLSDIFLDVTFDHQSASLQGRFQTQPGQVQSGPAAFRVTDAGAGTIQGRFQWQDPEWQGHVNIRTDKLTIVPQPDMIIDIKPDISLALSQESLAVSGQVEVPYARIVVKELPKQAASPSTDAVIRGAKKQQSSPYQLQTDVDLILGEDVKFKGFGLETGLTGKLDFQQRMNKPLQANGIINLQSGRYEAYGQRLRIRRGTLIFLGDITNPDVSIEAIRSDIRDNVEVGLRASGPVRNPQISLFSKPAMPDQNKMQYLLTGKGPGQGSTREREMARKAALSLSLAGTDSYIGSAAQRLGVEDFEIGTEDTKSGTQVQVSGYLSSDLFIQYGHGVFEEANSITMRYRLAEKLFLEAISSSANALDLIYSFQVD